MQRQYDLLTVLIHNFTIILSTCWVLEIV